MRNYRVFLILVICIFILTACQNDVPQMPSSSRSTIDPLPTWPLPTQMHPTQPTVQEPENPDLLSILSQERMALIELYGKQNGMLGDYWPRFRDLAPGKDGLRYYGSFTITDGNGITRRYDIIYVPYPDLVVPTSLSLQGNIFESDYAFCLYAFCFHEYQYEGIGHRYAEFIPLVQLFTKGLGNEVSIPDSIIVRAAWFHRQCEIVVKTNNHISLPTGEEYERMRVQATWILATGRLPAFDDPTAGHRYYGKLNGCDVFYIGGAGIPEANKVIGNEIFQGGGYKIIVCKNNTFYSLEETYDLGIIDDEALSQLAQIHNHYAT